ncbi:MAG: hypothetical protein P1U41_08790 [Vicingaceae bacterium]|nr:hypothetical protein [Vicingaceae bacterium]
MNKEITYPQYRKYSNNKSYFKIISSEEFEEIQLLGTKKSVHLFKAKILPDRNLIYDMTFDYEKSWVKIEKDEYEQVKNQGSFS